MKRIFLQPAYVLHTRYYRNTSFLVDFYTKQFGRITALARGVRAPHNPSRALLQPFIPLHISWYKGNSELVNLQGIEVAWEGGQAASRFSLGGSSLLTGFYINELMIRLIKPADPSQELFLIYQQALKALSNAKEESGPPQKNLRIFEKRLLAALGYGVTFYCDQFGNPIDPDARYFYEHQKGLRRVDGPLQSQALFWGSSLLSFGKEELCDRKSLQDAKRLMRQILVPHLGDKPLQSRRLFYGIIK